MASSASFVLFNSVFPLNQPLFNDARLPVAVWGLIGALAQLCAAGYNHFAGSIEKRVGRKYALLFAMGYGAGGFFLMAAPHPVAVAFGFLLLAMMLTWIPVANRFLSGPGQEEPEGNE